MDTIDLVVAEYLDRQSRRSHPDGWFDRAGRWFPDRLEYAPCCDKIRPPSRAYPYSLLTHCRSLLHIATREGVDPQAARRRLAELQPRSRPERQVVTGWKAVWLTEQETYRSWFAPDVVYTPGTTYYELAKPNHASGLYVAPTIPAAATFWAVMVRLWRADGCPPRPVPALVPAAGGGRIIEYSSKWCVSRLYLPPASAAILPQLTSAGYAIPTTVLTHHDNLIEYSPDYAPLDGLPADAAAVVYQQPSPGRLILQALGQPDADDVQVADTLRRLVYRPRPAHIS